jgi:hypothetical protein
MGSEKMVDVTRRKPGSARARCGFFGCRGCSACDPDHHPPAETDLQRRKREESAAREVGEPTLRVKMFDAAKFRKGT